MRVEVLNAQVVDPLHPQHGQLTHLLAVDGRWAEHDSQSPPPDKVIDLAGALTLAGGIDIHTHIGGGKVNLARMLMHNLPREGRSVWPAPLTGQLYNAMGYTVCFEPAMMLSTARHTHLELADTANIDSGAYVVLGNEDWLLKMLGQAAASGTEDPELDALVAWSVHASKALAIKVVNPGGINAFKFNQRFLDVDQHHSHYGVRPRDVIRRLAGSVDRLGLPHPLHVHASNLGVPGNIASTLQTLEAAEGHRIHLTHAQFHCYSDVGPYGMGSGSEQLAQYVNQHANVSLDVGQVVFGQTVTISADTAAQYRNRVHARPKQWIVSDVECQAGCGVVPMKYENRQYVHSLQWTIGLELMLLIDDPWRVFLTTDHPNGGPFTSYPHLIRLLMDRNFRKSQLENLHSSAASNTLLQEIDREYTLDEIAILTRCGPAQILGLADRGTLRPGAIADLAAYRRADDWETTFTQAVCVLKNGQAVVQAGQPTGASLACQTLHAQPPLDDSVVAKFAGGIESVLQQPLSGLSIGDDELAELIRRPSQSTNGILRSASGAVDGN